MEDDKNKKSDLIRDTVGDIGRWQISVCVVAALVKLAVSCQTFNIVFIAANVDHWCSAPAALKNISKDIWRSISQPPGTDGCVMYDRDYSQSLDYLLTHPPGPEVGHIDCQTWDYDTSEFPLTITSEWDLVCWNHYLADLAQSVFMFGVLVGSVLFGMQADSFGRKPALMTAMMLLIVGGLVSAFTPWLELLFVTRFFTASAAGGLLVITFVICVESMSNKWRTVVSALYHIPFSLGVSVLALISYFVRNWRYNQVAITVPAIVLIFFIWWVIPESPRWLVTIGREDEAVRILERAARWNNLDESIIKGQVSSCTKELTVSKESNKTDKKATIVDLFKTPNMRLKTICILFSWVACGICFYGLHLYVGNFGDIFLNVALSGLIEIPGFASSMYFLDKFGRKSTTIVSLMLSGCACLLLIGAVHAPSDLEWIKVTLACVGILGSSLAFAAVYTYSGELFPTVVRNVAIGTGSMFARIGAIVSPFVVTLNVYGKTYPPLIFGLLTLVGSLLCFFLPETLGSRLPDTMEEGEQFGKKSQEKTRSDAYKYDL